MRWIRHQRDSRDPSHAVIAAGLIAFRLAGFASTHAHDNCRPDFLQRREMFAHCFQRGPEIILRRLVGRRTPV
jgi:hypothetical protein